MPTVQLQARCDQGEDPARDDLGTHDPAKKPITHCLESAGVVKAGPKAAASTRPLQMPTLPTSGAERAIRWIERFVVTPKGTGAREQMQLRPWQRQLLAGIFDEPRPRLALWSLPRGNGKSTLAAALGLYALHADGVEGARVVVVAADERQARIVFNTAVRMTQLSPKLALRTQVYANEMVVPRTDSRFAVLPAEAHRLEGLDPSIAIIDEIGVVDRRVYEVIALASGKRPTSLVLCIGTPSPSTEDSVMHDLREHALAHPDDRSFAFAEFSAPIRCDVDDETAWAAANPGLDDLLYRDALAALLPPKTREATFRRQRLGQWANDTDGAWLPVGAWASVGTGDAIPDGADVVLALDGSFNQDATGLVAATITSPSHLAVVGLWEPPDSDPDYRVPVADVEAAIRAACRRWQVREVVADPFRWTRTLQALEAERLPMVEMPQTAQRMTPATTGLYEAVVNRAITHDGNPDLARHVGNATVRDDARGVRLAKQSRGSRRRIDLAVCAVMAHARAQHYAQTPIRRRRVVAFR